MPTRLALKLFGSLTVLHNEQALEIRSQKAVALLVYLALQRRRFSRDFLATMLWPEANQERARANLRRALWTLNQTPFGGSLVVSDDSVALLPEGLAVDAVEFERLLARGPHDVAALERAACLYSGDLLADFSLPDCGDFELWLTGEQESYRRRALETLYTLTAHFMGQEDYGTASRFARRQIAIDNLHEPAFQQLFRALAANGQRTAALSEYAMLRNRLHTELNVEPSGQTLLLIEQIRLEQRATRLLQPDPPAPSDREQQRQQPAAQSQLAACPYRGLLSFREEDASSFFGREDIVDQLVLSVGQRPVTAVIGPSGAGKSSVIHAGLIPALRRRGDWLVVCTRPGNRPFHELAASLLPMLTPNLSDTEQLLETRRLADALQAGQLSLVDVLERLSRSQDASRRRRVLLAVDHLAELYSGTSDSTLVQGYIDALLELAQLQLSSVAPRYAVVVALRTDFLGQAMGYRPLADGLTGATVLLGPMTRAELTRAVVNPAHLHQVSFEPGLVDRILREVGSEPASLPLLEFALAALWERQDAGRLTHAAYDAIGGVEAALAGHAESVTAALSPADQALARRIFTQLVRPGVRDASRIATRGELGDTAWRLVTQLADSRLLVTGMDSSQHQTIEIIHDALIHHWSRLRVWIDEDRAFRVWQERLRAAMSTWEAQVREDGALLRGSTLSSAQAWRIKRPDEIGLAEADYIDASAAFARRRLEERELEREALRKAELDLAASRVQRRRLGGLVVILLVALLVMATLWIAFYPW